MYLVCHATTFTQNLPSFPSLCCWHLFRLLHGSFSYFSMELIFNYFKNGILYFTRLPVDRWQVNFTQENCTGKIPPMENSIYGKFHLRKIPTKENSTNGKFYLWKILPMEFSSKVRCPPTKKQPGSRNCFQVGGPQTEQVSINGIPEESKLQCFACISIQHQNEKNLEVVKCT